MSRLWFVVSQAMDEDIGCIQNFKDIALALHCDEVTVDDMMEALNEATIERQSNLHLGNMHAEMILSRIQQAMREKHPQVDVSYYINAQDTHLHMDGEKIYCYWGDIVPILQGYEDPDE